MKKIPHFAGKNSLSLTDLQALADAVPPPCPHVQPAAATRGRVQYDNADYNLATLAADECSGTAARPDSPGMLATVAYAAADAPYIDAGNLVLPLAHDYSPEDSSLPDESATGGMRGVQVTGGLQRPMINRGLLGLPLAQSSWDDAEGAMYTPGLVYGVQYDPVDDACEGAVLPRIDQGIIHLPAPTFGGGDDDCTGSCSCPLAQDYDTTTVPGLMTGLEVGSTSGPEIVDGVAYLPLASWAASLPYNCGHYGLVRSIDLDGGEYGFITNGDIHAPWALRSVMPDPEYRTSDYPVSLYGLEGCGWCPVTMSKCTLPDGTVLYLNAWVENGGLCLSLSTNSYYSY